MIHAYAQFDLLDCKRAVESGDSTKLVIGSLMSGPRKVLEYTMTFVNALASECLGRSYLLQKPNLVEMLVNMLN